MREWRRCDCLPYEASNDGLIRRVGKRKLMAMSPAGNGYLKVTICVLGVEHTRTVHTLVALAFHGPALGRVVNHLNGKKRDNAPLNLEYTTPAGNSAHAAKMGLCPTGSRHGRHTKPWASARGERVNTARLSESQVRAMRKMWDGGATLSILVRAFGLSKSATWAICVRHNWRHVA